MRARNLAVAAAVGAGLLAVYGPLVARGPVLSRDDATLLDQVRALGSPLEWPRAVMTGRLLDVQPVRDASLALDLRLSRALGRGTFHATNLLIWAAIVVLAFFLFRRQAGAELALAALPLFALHPIFAGSVGWISARKHLMACLFALAATLVLLRAIERRDGRARTALLLAALYSLSVLSQPITLLWPLWAALAVGLLAPAGERARLWRLPAFALPLCMIFAAANALYYGHVYVAATGSGKLVDASIAARLLSLGRYAANLLWPVALAAQYSPASALNLIGLCLLPAAIWLLARRAPRSTLLWISLAASALLVVTLRMTNIFVSDTYALLPAVGAFCALLAALKKKNPLRKAGEEEEGRNKTEGLSSWFRSSFLPSLEAFLLLFLALPAAWLCARQARTWASDGALWAHAAAVEPSPDTLVRLGGQLLDEGKTAEARAVAERVIAWDPAQTQLPRLYARAVARDAALHLQQKLRLLEAHAWDDPWRDYFLGSLWAQANQPARAAALYQRALQRPAAFRHELPVVAAEGFWLCQKAGLSECAAWISPLRPQRGWSEEGYQRRLASLNR